jgi:hypothetical protein
VKNVSKMSDRELRNELTETRGLLAAAKCPSNCEDGTVVHGAHEHGDGDVEWDISECQWCSERSRLIGAL